MRPVVLDTDIGTDVDDLLALVFIAKAPELWLEGITTVHGNTLLRAKIARVACQMLGLANLTIVPGAVETLSGQPIFWPGHEGEDIPELESAEVESSVSAPQYLFDLSERYRDQLEVLAIGPLTNLAQTITSFPKFRSNVKRLHLMGGAYWVDYPEHNIEADVLAAKIVFEAGIPITAIGLDVTLKVWLREGHLRQIETLPNGLGSMLAGQIRRWWAFLGRNENNPHDPLAALAMIRPDLLAFQDCEVEICTEKERQGHVKRFDSPKGNVRAAYDLDVDTAQRMLFNYLLS
jgi:purine nucleosidase